MFKIDAGRDFIYVLASGPARPDKTLDYVRLLYPKTLHLYPERLFLLLAHAKSVHKRTPYKFSYDSALIAES